MPPQVILIRHAQALHNLDDKGFAQCEQLAIDLKGRFEFGKDDTLIVVSPLRRTLQSFQTALGWLEKEGVPVQLRAEWQETTANPCDVGTEIERMSAEWPNLDFSTLDPLYPAKTGFFGASEEAILNRALFARQWLYQRPEKYIIVMTHSGFIRRVVPGKKKYANVEYRVYEFAEEVEGPSRRYDLVELEQVHQSLETQQASVL